MTSATPYQQRRGCPRCVELTRQSEELRLPLAELRSAVQGRPGTAGLPSARSTDDGTLTEREWQVLALIAQGRSNSEIAAEVFLSINTVKTHVKNAYRKIGVSNRTEAAVWVMRPAPAPSDLAERRHAEPDVAVSPLAG
jgi:DNA-binding NarL/FixJ family response regulator